MPFKHRPEVRGEAIALARIVGSEAAGEKLGIPYRTIRRWMVDAGLAPELDLPPDCAGRTSTSTARRLPSGTPSAGAIARSRIRRQAERGGPYESDPLP